MLFSYYFLKTPRELRVQFAHGVGKLSRGDSLFEVVSSYIKSLFPDR